ncbi:MAG: ATP-binding protein [Bacteroidales bacterium]|nr:ATP-binding protein [Bacteroidales bacterium]
MKDKLLQVAYSQKERLPVKSGLIERDCMPLAKAALMSDNRVLVVTGMRRVGKSTLVQQLMATVDTFCYFNFEDEKLLDFTVDHFGELEETLIEVYGPAQYWFFDEIQNVKQFEIAIRRLQDSGKKIVLTGSNSSMLSMEFGSKLTGRYKQIELFPFSFSEYLRFRNVTFQEKDFYLPESKVMLKTYFMQWMEDGGLPEFLKYNDQEYVRTLFDNILYRDIIVRYGIRRHREFRELVQLLVSNISLPVTFSSLQRSIGFSNSDTVKEYMSYLSNAYVFFEMRQYHDSLKKQLRHPRKVFVNDIAFHNLVGFSNSQNLGRKLENAVYLALRRKSAELYSFYEKGECDFILFDEQRKPMAIQVCYNLNSENEAREMDGLAVAMNFFNLSEGLILTLDQDFEIQKNGKSIPVIPVWKWLIGNSNTSD